VPELENHPIAAAREAENVMVAKVISSRRDGARQNSYP